MNKKNTIRIYRSGVVSRISEWSETLPKEKLVNDNANVWVENGEISIGGEINIKSDAKRVSVVSVRMNGRAFYDFVTNVVMKRLENPEARKMARAMLKHLEKLEELEKVSAAKDRIISELLSSAGGEGGENCDWDEELIASGFSTAERKSLSTMRSNFMDDPEKQ